MRNFKNQNELKILPKIFTKLFQIFLLFFKIKSEITQITECPRDLPILISNDCKLEYCEKSQFDSNYCQIKNSTVKTQWLNNINVISDRNYRYINIASSSNGDMIIGTTSYPGTTKRIFYGLKQNGRPFFKDKETNEETFHYSKEVVGEDYSEGKYESESIIIKHSNTGKEYFLSVSKMSCYAEMFDLDNDEVHFHPSYYFAAGLFIVSIRNTFFSFATQNEYDNNYYYFFGFIATYLDNDIKKVYFQKHIFRNFDNFENDQHFDSGSDQPNAYGNGISCFQTTNLKFIICFYFININNIIYYNIIKYDEYFQNNITLNFSSNVEDENNFLKCIHLKGELGIFAYYKSYLNILYPVLLFKIYAQTTESFENYLPNSYTDSSIILQKYQFISDILLNDIIKINENKIVFSATLQDRETLYIIVLNIFGDINIKIRYYSIKLFSLYHYKIYKELRIHNYNNFIAFSSSYCPNEQCNNHEDDNYSGLIIFSYPNSKDYKLYLDKYIF